LLARHKRRVIIADKIKDSTYRTPPKMFIFSTWPVCTCCRNTYILYLRHPLGGCAEYLACRRTGCGVKCKMTWSLSTDGYGFHFSPQRRETLEHLKSADSSV